MAYNISMPEQRNIPQSTPDTNDLGVEIDSDFLPNLGCSLSAWREITRYQVQRNYNSIMHINSFESSLAFIENGDGIANRTLRRKINVLLGLVARANDPSVPAGSDSEHFKGVTVVNVVFSREDNLANADIPFTSEQIHDSLISALIAEQDRNIINVDFTQPDFTPQARPKPTEGGNRLLNDALFYGGVIGVVAALDYISEKTGKPVYIIFDGINWNTNNKARPTSILDRTVSRISLVRADQGFIEPSLDQLGDTSNGLPSARMGEIFGGVIHGDVPEVAEPFNPRRFDVFAKVLDETVGLVESGKDTYLQAPNRHGKTTAIRQLGYMTEKLDLALAEINHEGNLVFFTHLEPYEPYPTDLSDVKTLVLNEAGADNLLSNQGKETIAQLIAQGTKIVKIYPGSSVPPKEAEGMIIDNNDDVKKI